MRKLTSILLLTCLCCALFGYHVFFHFQIAAVKSEMKEFLRKQKIHKDVVQISFDKQEVEKIEWENENEFRYNDEMYDVIEKKTEGSRLVIRCIPDEKETALLMDYQKTSKQNSSGTIVIQLIALQFVLPAECPLQQPQFISDRNFPQPSSALLKQVSPVVPPPPDVC